MIEGSEIVEKEFAEGWVRFSAVTGSKVNTLLDYKTLSSISAYFSLITTYSGIDLVLE